MSRKSIKLAAYNKKKRIAVLRYALTSLVCLIISTLYFVPCLSFTDGVGDKRASSSVFSRIFENFSQARKVVLINDAQTDAAYMAFSRLILALISVTFILFAIGAVVSLCYTFIGILHTEQRAQNARRIFITLIPNKTVLFVLLFLSCTPAFFPLILVKLIETYLVSATVVHYTFGPVVLWCICLWLTLVVTFILTNKYELSEFNIFSVNGTASLHSEAEDMDEEAADGPLERMTALSKEEQAEKIRALLRKNNSKENSGEE